MASDEAGERVWNNYEELLDKMHGYQNRAERLQEDMNILITNLGKCTKSFVLNTTEMVAEVTNGYQNLMKLQGGLNKKKHKVKGHLNDPDLPNDLSHVSNNTTFLKSNSSTPLVSLKEKRIRRKRTSQTFDYSNIQNLEEFNVPEPSQSKKAVIILEDVLVSEGCIKNDNIKMNEEVQNKKNSNSNKRSKSLSHRNKKIENSNLLDTPRSSAELRSRKRGQSISNADDNICRKSSRISAHPPGYFQTKPHTVVFVECSSTKMERMLIKQKVISSNMEGVENPTISTSKNKPDGN